MTRWRTGRPFLRRRSNGSRFTGMSWGWASRGQPFFLREAGRFSGVRDPRDVQHHAGYEGASRNILRGNKWYLITFCEGIVTPPGEVCVVAAANGISSTPLPSVRLPWVVHMVAVGYVLRCQACGSSSRSYLNRRTREGSARRAASRCCRLIAVGEPVAVLPAFYRRKVA